MGLIVAAALLVVIVVLGVLLALRPRAARQEEPTGNPLDAPAADESSRRRAAIIVNPTKFDDVEETRRTVTRVCRANGWAAPLWIETTAEDPGTGQAKEALEAGVDMICPLGGDGTVRSVAAALVGTETPMGLLPGGTGNLLARNLELPVDSLEKSLEVALNGRTDVIDVGTINVMVPGDTQDDEKDYYFLVMAGLGFDASVMADAPEKLKAQFGWPAYVVAGMKHLHGKRFPIDVQIDGGKTFHRKIRTIVIGNVGRLQGGVELLPQAEADDGSLDVVLLSPRFVLDWLSVAAHILTRSRFGHPRIEHHRCRTMSLEVGNNQEVQLDGDPIGPGGRLRLAVRPHSLRVRVA